MLSREILDRPSLVIIIDCWNDRQSNQYLSTLNNIKSFCETSPNVQAIGLASYIGMNQDYVAKEEPWWSGGANFFHNTTRWETLKKTWEEVSFVNRQATHPIIRNILARNDQVQFIAWSSLQILYYCNHINPSIENIFIVGTAWNVCLEFRSVGWTELHNLNQYNIFSRKKTILSRLDCVLGPGDTNVINVVAPWKKLDSNIVLLS